MKLSDLKVGDVLIPKRSKVPKKVVRITLKNDQVYSVHLDPMNYWKGVTYKASSSYSRTLHSNGELNGDYHYDGNTNEQEGNNTMSKLFKVIGEEVYGIHIGTNTAGELVLEIRGDTNNAIKAFKKDTLEEVKPYTVKLVAMGSNENPRHVTVEKGKLSKQDVIVWQQRIWVVAELDTKQDDCPEMSDKNAKRLVVGEL
jgi:hypothetical protein